MSRLIWFFGWVGVAVWSLVCLVAYLFVDLVGTLVARNADLYSNNPETVEWLWRLLDGLRSASTGAVLVIWAIVSLLILAVPWIFSRLIAGPSGVRIRSAPARFGVPPGHAPGDVIDLGPDQYSVRPPGAAGPAGPAPRIGARR